MYSVVLMAALTTTTADVPSFGGRGCHGCWGARSGCYGCNGCYGYGGCYGGCNGGCWGCYGGARYHGHGGCNGCYGGCYSGGYGGCNGGCFGYACHGCQGYAGPTGVVVPPGPPPAGEPLMKPAPDKSTAPPPKTETSAGKGAKLIVDLPADAKLYIDDRPMKVNSQHPIFATPNLEYGKTYYYELRAEMVKDGKTLTDTKRVVFHAGDELRESFANLASAPTEKASAEKVAASALK